jgi:type I restriction enzyme S subunit
LNPPLAASLSDGDDVSFMPMAAVDADSVTAVDRETRLYSEVSKGYTPFLDGDLLVAKITPCFENGKIAQARLSRRYGFGSTEFHVVRPRSDRADARYLVHFLRQDRIRKQGESRMTGSAGQRRVPENFLAGLTIPLPPLPEQRRIAEILDKADALRAKRRAALAQLDTLTQSIFLDMFGDAAINPRAWRRVGLREAYWFQEGPGVRKWQFQDEGVKLLNVGNIESNGRLNLDKTSRYLAKEEAFGKYRHFLVDAGDLVIASSGISFDDDNLLRTRGAFVSEDQLPLCMNTSTIRFKAIEGVSDLRFLWVWLNSSEFRGQITRLVTGSAQQNFGPSHLSLLKVTLPPLSTQHEFARRVLAIDELRRVQHASSTELDSLFASLQQRAFRGEL